MACPVAEFMQGGAVPGDRLEVALRPWQLDVGGCRSVEGLLAAKPQIGAAGADQRLNLGQDQPFRDGCRESGEIIRQSLALRGVEDRESFARSEPNLEIIVVDHDVIWGIGRLLVRPKDHVRRRLSLKRCDQVGKRHSAPVLL